MGGGCGEQRVKGESRDAVVGLLKRKENFLTDVNDGTVAKKASWHRRNPGSKPQGRNLSNHF